MNAEFIVIRLLHIIPGVAWAGTALFVALVIAPRLRSFGSPAEAELHGSIVRSAARLMNIAGGLTVVFGIALLWRMNGFSTILSSSWGVTILVGFLAAFLGLFALGAMTGALSGLLAAVSGSSEANEVPVGPEVLAKRVAVMAYANAAFVMIAVAAMAMARFV